MISCNNDVMTPLRHVSFPTQKKLARNWHTKGVPKYERELGYLLSLLAQFQQRGFTGVLVQEVRYVGHGAAIVFRDQGLMASIMSVGTGKAANRAMESGDPVIVLLLGCGGCRGLVLLRRLHPGRVRMGVELVMPVDVGGRHHLD